MEEDLWMEGKQWGSGDWTKGGTGVGGIVWVS